MAVLLIACKQNQEQNSDYLIWYKTPAKVWEEALPIGNGRLGAIIFGNPFHETIQVNEESLWAGSQINGNNPKAAENLGKIRELILHHKYAEAKSLAAEVMVGTPPRIRSYQTFGDILLDYDIKDTTNYRRSLDLSRGIYSTTFTSQGIDYEQTSFASAVDDVITTHIHSSQQGALNLHVRLQREKDVTTRVEGNEIIMEGQIIDENDPRTGEGGAHMKFAAKLRVLQKGVKLRKKMVVYTSVMPAG